MAYTYVKPSATHTPTTGAVIPTANWGTKVNAAFDLLAPNSCIVRRAATQSIAGTTTTNISFDTEDIDDNSMYAAGTATRITFPRKGIYFVDVNVAFASNSTGVRLVTMPRSGGASDRGQYTTAINGYETPVAFSFITAERSAGDYYEFAVWQNSGGSLNITARVAVALIQDRT
jgi:hypothetical protein